MPNPKKDVKITWGQRKARKEVGREANKSMQRKAQHRIHQHRYISS